MSDELLKTLVPALGIAAFERRPDGSFGAVAPLPTWFERLVGDGTFPFLGHMLEEAGRYWNKGESGPRNWGPCAEVDEAGREFHYTVTAVTVAGRNYLLFQLDPGSDRLRITLQKVREQALVAEQREGSDAAIATALQHVRETAEELRDLLRRFSGAPSSQPDLELRRTLSATCDDLLKRVDAFVSASASPLR